MSLFSGGPNECPEDRKLLSVLLLGSYGIMRFFDPQAS